MLLDDEVLRLPRVGALDGVPAQGEAVARSAAELRAPGPVPAVAG